MHIRYNVPSKFYEYLSSTGPDVWTELPLDASQISDGLLSPAIGGVPVGAIIAYGGTSAPSGYVLCDGSSLLRASFAALFAVIGTTFGSVDGTHFTIPDLRQRFPIGKAAAGTGSTLGGVGGSIDHTHTSAAHTHTYTDIINHLHTITDPGHFHLVAEVNGGAATSFGLPNALIPAAATYNGRSMATGAPPASAELTGITGTNNPTGGVAIGTTASTTPGVTGSNNPPFQTVNFIIKT